MNTRSYTQLQRVPTPYHVPVIPKIPQFLQDSNLIKSEYIDEWFESPSYCYTLMPLKQGQARAKAIKIYHVNRWDEVNVKRREENNPSYSMKAAGWLPS